MIGSKERINLIIEYISALEEKIKLANANHFFDEAQLFELFAQEICKIWYGQSFSNLNLMKYNYPCVDLISEDKSLFVQVSTQKDIFGKIKNTLESLKNTDKPELKSISSPIFFVLSNESENRVKDLIGDEQIGNFPFTVNNNFISTTRIIQRASSDLVFQKELYNFLKHDVEGLSTLSEKLLSQFSYSKEVGFKSIDAKINAEYEIDRTELISRIRNEAKQFSLVCGEAGCGKSAICKKLLENEKKVLFVRAEALEKCNSIDEIWGIEINKAFNYLNGKKLTIYFDALEYIANSGESTKDLLQALLLEVSKHPSVAFIASCRSCDTNAFVKQIGIFAMKEYLVDCISDIELKGICDKYYQIKEMTASGKYSDLLRSPFYINEIVSKDIHLSEPSDVNGFRDYIWNECICLNKKAVEKGISTIEVIDAIEHLVFERSKRMVTGIDQDEIDSKILKLLRSNNVVTKNERLIRLKYDIYEDICFERKLDNIFNSSRGVYSVFFKNIEQLGNGAYRRYQIWLSNKLLAKENRDKFLHELIFQNDLSGKWRKNTIIGLVKSPYCESFFEEQGTNLIEKQIIGDFIDCTNYYAFDMTGFYSDDYRSIYVLHLKACGHGRNALISLIYKKELYKNDFLEKNKIIKLCKDYATRSDHQDETDKVVCSIICVYLDEFFKSITEVTEEDLNNNLYPMLETVYSLPTQAHSRIQEYWTELIACYKSNDIHKCRVAEKILCWTIKHVNTELVAELTNELLDIAETIWIFETEKDKKCHETYGYGLRNDFLWGIHGAGENYQHDYQMLESVLFFRLVFRKKLKISLEWAISLLNKMASAYEKNCPNKVCTVTLFDCENNNEHSYIGAAEMWLAGRVDYAVPTLIGDIVYWLKETLIQLLNDCKTDLDLIVKVSSFIKSEILEKSTSIIPLVIIEEIGYEFSDYLPAFATVLASSLNIIYWDLQWQAHRIITPAQAILKNQITMSVGIPSLEERYPRKNYIFSGIQEYVAWCQLANGDLAREHSIATIDYLYKNVDENSIPALLQIQKMDMRNADYSISGENTIIIKPRLTDGPQRIVNENEHIICSEERILNKLNLLLKDGKIESLEEILNTIEYIKTLMDTREHIVEYENYYIIVIVMALKNNSLSKEKRTELVCDWAERLENVITHKSSYVADLNLSPVLFDQCKKNLGISAKNKLKRLMLDCLIDCSSDGQSRSLCKMVVRYLLKDDYLAKVFFNTIINLSDDEWKHSSYNQKIIQKNMKKGYCISARYGIPQPDDIIKALKIEPFVSKREEIIERFLINEEILDVEKLDVNYLDQGLLFIAMDVGLHLSNETFYSFCKRVMPLFIQSMNNDQTYSTMDTYFQRLRVQEMFKRELTDEIGDFTLAVNLLFDDIDYGKFVHETNKTYISIFERLDTIYFDSYNDMLKRKHCRNCIEYTATKIENIKVPFVKHELEGVLIFSSEYMYGDWNKCETHYSYDDKVFLCGLWNKHISGHEEQIIRTMYQMKTGELLPEVLPVIARIVSSLDNKGESIDGDCMIILKTIILRSLLDFSDRIKADEELHNAYEQILSALISRGDESAAVILDEYNTH